MFVFVRRFRTSRLTRLGLDTGAVVWPFWPGSCRLIEKNVSAPNDQRSSARASFYCHIVSVFLPCFSAVIPVSELEISVFYQQTFFLLSSNPENLVL